MKALKSVLAILLAAILAGVLWRDDGKEALEAPALKEDAAAPPDKEAEEAPSSDLLIRHPAPVAPVENFRPPVPAKSERLAPNPYTAIPWEVRLPFRQSHIDRGLYIVPMNRKVEH